MDIASGGHPRDVLDVNCPSRLVLQRLGGKWTSFVLIALGDHGTARFAELRSAIGEISPKVLTEIFRGLERDGLVRRAVFAEVPPRVEYSLTELGASLGRSLEGIRAWAQLHADDILAARERSELAADELVLSSSGHGAASSAYNGDFPA